MLIRQIYKPNNEMRKTMFQNHRLSYDDDDLLRRKSPLASKRRETVQRGNDSARRPKCSVSAAPVESGRRDVGANSLLSTLLRYLASLLAGSTLASLMPPAEYNCSVSAIREVTNPNVLCRAIILERCRKTGAAFRSSHQGGWMGGWVKMEMGVRGEEGMCERFCEPNAGDSFVVCDF